jgi:hypothetical protein
MLSAGRPSLKGFLRGNRPTCGEAEDLGFALVSAFCDSVRGFFGRWAAWSPERTDI